jgi:hypothetical protein
MNKRGGIFCLEGSWALDGKDLTDKSSVEQQLRMLEGAGECGPVIHRDVATREEFEYYLREWLKAKYRDKYPIAYLAFHGFEGGIGFGDVDLSLGDLAGLMGSKATQRIIYFGSCSTMAAPEPELRGFCRSTGAKAIVGFTKTVGWRESAAFDVLLLPRLLEMTNMKSAFTALEREYRDLVSTLGLRMATKVWATDQESAVQAMELAPPG